MQSFPFTTLPKGPFSFVPTLDGLAYSANVTWSIFGRRWYLNLTDSTGAHFLTTAVVESPPFAPIGSLEWDSLRQIVVLTAAAPHGLPVGGVAMQTIRGCSPDSYNGLWQMKVVSSTELTYVQTSDPGALVALGSFGRDIDLVDAYFSISSLVYRQGVFYTYP